MLYTIVFVEKSQLRDIQLEKLFSDDGDSSLLYDGDYKWFTRIGAKGYTQLWSSAHYPYGERGLANCSKWKTIRGAKNAANRISTIDRYSIRGDNNLWNKDLFVPVVYDITEKWNKYINDKIQSEIKSHKKKIEILTKKLDNV